MNDLPRQKLQFILSQYGRSICDEPKRCEGMLKDLCNGECKREITVLIGALRENVAKELLAQSATLPIEAIAPKLTQRLYDDLGIAEEFAQWAVETWALALGLLAAPLPTFTLKKTSHQTSEVSKTSEVLTLPFTVDLGKGVTLELLAIPGGTFLMGAPNSEENSYDDERPQHRVTLQPFYMGKYPVTQAQWQAVMGSNPSYFNGAKRPVEQVSWNDAQAFLKNFRSLGDFGNLTPRLPSEAEWEYACRAGTTTPFYFGDTISADQANYDGNYTYGKGKKGVYREQTTDVGSFPPNAFGLCDMHGNVWEWCADTWHENYDGAPSDGSIWGNLGDGKAKLLRGGSWLNNPGNCRSAYRGRNDPVDGYGNFGARVVVGAR